jgi:apolipoprotein N-acyltransferase
MLLKPILNIFSLVVAGAISTLAFAPFSYPLLALISIASLYLLTHKSDSGFRTGWLYGLGYFTAGVSWVYVSIHSHGGMGVFAALLMTLAFTGSLATLFGAQIWLYKRLFSKGSAPGFIALWILFEWLRSWLFTGFPWLLIGYAFIDTPLISFAPIGGVWLVSAMALIIAVTAAKVINSRRPSPLLLILAILGTSYLLPMQWTEHSDRKVSVTLIQPNLAQESKWKIEQVDRHIQNIINLSVQAPASDLIIWPETAVPKLIANAINQISPLVEILNQQGTTLISGFPRKEWSESQSRNLYHNSVGTLTGDISLYDKQRLVPFGEYIPFEKQLRGVIAFFDLPMSNFSLPEQPTYQIVTPHGSLAGAICYEIAYPELVRENAHHSDMILTLSNDTWFGGSHGPDQHFEIARMRAIENGKPVIRATNNGISGFIDATGRVLATAPRFETAIITYELSPSMGQTPYQQLGLWPTLLLSVALSLTALIRHRSFKHDR